jgi:hypothetical protein
MGIKNYVMTITYGIILTSLSVFFIVMDFLAKDLSKFTKWFIVLLICLLYIAVYYFEKKLSFLNIITKKTTIPQKIKTETIEETERQRKTEMMNSISNYIITKSQEGVNMETIINSLIRTGYEPKTVDSVLQEMVNKGILRIEKASSQEVNETAVHKEVKQPEPKPEAVNEPQQVEIAEPEETPTQTNEDTADEVNKTIEEEVDLTDNNKPKKGKKQNKKAKFVCNICGEEFERKTKFAKHVTKEH